MEGVGRAAGTDFGSSSDSDDDENDNDAQGNEQGF
jgi:hypothetical protein